MNSFKRNIMWVLILLSSGSIYSQGFEYGIKVGIPLSNIQITDVPSFHLNADKPIIWMHYFKPKIGFNVSLTGGFNVNPKIYIGIEPGYILKGSHFSSPGSKLDLHYLNLPAILKYRYSDLLSIYTGLEFSKLLEAKLDFDGRIINMDSFYDDKIETSFLLGVEYRVIRYPILGARLNYGLTSVSVTNWSDESGYIYARCNEINYYLLVYAAMTIN